MIANPKFVDAVASPPDGLSPCGLSPCGLSPYGAMRSLMHDHIYIPGECSQIYTSPCITASVSTPFDVMIALTACRQSITIQMGDHVAQGSALIAGARARHMRAEGVQLVIIQLNPFHHRYRSFRHLHTAVSLNRDRFSRFDAELDAAYKGELSLNEAQLLYRGVVMEVANDLPIMKPLDARVQETMRLLHDNPRVTLNELASHCDLSYDRMSHLFIDELGISIRSFQLWVKLHRALTGVRYGQSLVELARVAGFSDAAHLSRVYKQVYGAPPSYFYYSGNLKLIASFAGEVPGALPAIAAKLPVASEQNTTDLMLG